MSIAESLIELNNTKQSIKAAIEAKGQNLSGVPFTGYADKIANIETSGTGTEITLPYAEEFLGAVGRLAGQDSGSLKARLFRQLGGTVEFQNLPFPTGSRYIAYDMGNDSWFIFTDISGRYPTATEKLYYVKYREGTFSTQELSTTARVMSSVALVDGQLTYIENFSSTATPSFRLSTINFDENGDVVLGTPQTLVNTVSHNCGGCTARQYYNGKFYVISCGNYDRSALITKFSYNSDDNTYSLTQAEGGRNGASGYSGPPILNAYIIGDDGYGITWGYIYLYRSDYVRRIHKRQYFSMWDTTSVSRTDEVLLSDHAEYLINSGSLIQPLGTNDVLAKNSTTGDVVLFKCRGTHYEIVELSDSLTSLLHGRYEMARVHGESNRYMVYANTTVDKVEGIYLIIFGITGDTLTIYDTILTTLSSIPSSDNIWMGGVQGEYIDFYQSAFNRHYSQPNSVFAKLKRTWRENMLGFVKSINPTAQTWNIDTGTVITGLNTIAGYDYYAGENGTITNIANQYYVGHCTENGNLVFKDARWGKEILI
jgi:hypothetical protein